MPHATVKLTPGVNQIDTPALNEAGISFSNLIRFVPDTKLGGIVQKLGGWAKFFPNTIVSKVRALWAWEDTQSSAHLAVGTENVPGTFAAQLSVITDNALRDITPLSVTDNIAAAASSTIGSPFVIITDTTTTGITQYDSVYISVQISIGGIVLFGLYACDPDGYLSGTAYTIESKDLLGNPLAATATSIVPTLPLITTTISSTPVTVTLNNHGYVIGDAFPVLVKTIIGGITFFGNYDVQSVVDANNFIVNATSQATATTSGYINNNKAQFVYSLGFGALPPGTGYGVGGYGTGGYGTGTAVIPPSNGIAPSAGNWTLDNWGELLLSCPITDPVILTTSSMSGTGTVGTVNFTGGTYTITVGSPITISGVNPSSWNGTYIVTASTSSSVSFATAVTAAQVAAGIITVNNTAFHPIYEWDGEGHSPRAIILPDAPPVNDGFFVAMPQRQIVAWGSTFTGVQDPLLIRWCDVNNFTVWVAQITNQAGSYRLPKGSKIISGIQGPQQGLIWTDIGLWSMQYIGPPYIYSFNEVGSGCGIISRRAAGSLNGVVYWMGPSQMYRLASAGVETMACPVWDVIFQNLYQGNTEDIRVAVNSRFGEVGWFYPSKNGSGEVDSYIKYNVLLNQWDFGSLARSAWIDQSVLGPPIGADPNTLYLQQHETSTDADEQAMLPSFRTGFYAMTEADVKVFVDQIWPDFKFGYYGGTQSATVNISFYVCDYPEQNPTIYGPYAVTQSTTFVTPRFRGRLVSIEVSSNDVGSFWRIGALRYRLQQDGKF